MQIHVYTLYITCHALFPACTVSCNCNWLVSSVKAMVNASRTCCDVSILIQASGRRKVMLKLFVIDKRRTLFVSLYFGIVFLSSILCYQTMGPGGMFTRVIQLLVNEVIVKGLSNNPAFQRFAVRSSQRAKELSKSASESMRVMAESENVNQLRKVCFGRIFFILSSVLDAHCFSFERANCVFFYLFYLFSAIYGHLSREEKGFNARHEILRVLCVRKFKPPFVVNGAGLLLHQGGSFTVALLPSSTLVLILFLYLLLPAEEEESCFHNMAK